MCVYTYTYIHPFRDRSKGSRLSRAGARAAPERFVVRSLAPVCVLASHSHASLLSKLESPMAKA